MTETLAGSDLAAGPDGSSPVALHSPWASSCQPFNSLNSATSYTEDFYHGFFFFSCF